MIRSLIREFLLQEEVFGAQAFVYHGSQASPKRLLSVFAKDKFSPGQEGGDLYGKGLYTVYNLKNSRTAAGNYGQYIYKLKVNLWGLISFNPDITKLIYKKDLTPSEQAELVGVDEDLIKKIKKFDNDVGEISYSSDIARAISFDLRGKVKGLIYTGRGDGDCALIYDASVAVPVAWKKVDDTTWSKVDRESIKPALRRSSTGEWTQQKYESDPQFLLKQIGKLPIEKRVYSGNIDLSDTSIKSIPAGLIVKGDLNLSYSGIESLPAGIQIKKDLSLTGCNISSIPPDLKVGGSLWLDKTNIMEIPVGFKVGGGLYLSESGITSLPKRLVVGGSLNLYRLNIKSLPDDLKVKGVIAGYSGEVPEHLKSKVIGYDDRKPWD